MKRTLSEDAWLASIGKHRGVAIRILDVFEEMLESKGISIPDEDRTGDESEVCLYGIAYATLEDEIAELLRSYFIIDAVPKLTQDQHAAAVKVTRTIVAEGDLEYKDIRTFETEGYFGVWDHSENSFVLMAKTNFQFHKIVLETCYTLAELDDSVFRSVWSTFRAFPNAVHTVFQENTNKGFYNWTCKIDSGRIDSTSIP